MFRCLVGGLAVMLSACAVAQEAPAAPSDVEAAQVQPQRPVSVAAAVKEAEPIGAITFGYIYLSSETTPGGPWDWHLHGFYGIPQYNVKPWLVVFADFTQSYDTSEGAHQNVQSRFGGLSFTKKTRTRVSPFGFVNGGYVRDSANGRVTESPALAVGGGALLKLNRHVSLLMIPGEYVRTYTSGGDLNNFTTRIGITLPIYR
jgi:hypothetical protein